MRRKPLRPGGSELDRLYGELQIHQTELEEQNRELRQIQQRLEESRDRYADLYDFAPVGFVDLDGRGSIRSINLKGSTMLAEVRSRLAGMPFARFVDPNDRRKFLDHLRKCRAAEETETVEVVLRPKGGPPFPAQLQSVFSADREQGATAFRTAIMDMSDRKRAEEALRESEDRERFRSLVKDALVGFCIVQDGRIVFMNPVQEGLFGTAPASRPLADLDILPPEDRGKFLGLCGEDGYAGSGGGPVDLRLYHPGKRKKNREFRWVRCGASRLSWGGRPAVLVNMLDITRIRELEQANQVQERMAALGHMAAGIAHEIRNPLSGINIHLSALEQVIGKSTALERGERDTAEACLRHLVSASAKIATVIQRVMAFTRPIPPVLELVNVNDAVEEAMALASVMLRSHGVTIRKTLSPELPKCEADLHLVGQVLLNLITNADQAMEGRRGPRQVGIRTFQDGEWVAITVSDSGPGIPAHLREKIFDPYFTTKRDGTGIGLSFSHRVITAHKGILSVGPSSLGGVEFRILLPLRPGKEGT